MKLYSENNSPFSAPVRAAIYAKGLNIDIEPPPGGLLSAKFHTINSLGTIPCLILDDGTPLPESTVILEYLEDKFPEPSLRPSNPEAKARVRLLQRIGELGIMTPLVELFRQLDPGGKTHSSAVWLTRLIRGLSSLQLYIHDEPYAAGSKLTLADCELAPALFILPKITAAYGKPGLLNAYPTISCYIASCGQHLEIQRILSEMAPAWEHQTLDK
jgi:glutathione S-transferase